MLVKIDHFDLSEANEAFAAQAVADGKALGWDWERVNVNGGGWLNVVAVVLFGRWYNRRKRGR